MSSKGKNPSLAKTALDAFLPAASRAILADPILFVWPAPIPRVCPEDAIVIALERTCLTTFHAKVRSSF